MNTNDPYEDLSRVFANDDLDAAQEAFDQLNEANRDIIDHLAKAFAHAAGVGPDPGKLKRPEPDAEASARAIASNFTDKEVDQLHALGKAMDVVSPFDQEVEAHLQRIEREKKEPRTGGVEFTGDWVRGIKRTKPEPPPPT